MKVCFRKKNGSISTAHKFRQRNYFLKNAGKLLFVGIPMVFFGIGGLKAQTERDTLDSYYVNDLRMLRETERKHGEYVKEYNWHKTDTFVFSGAPDDCSNFMKIQFSSFKQLERYITSDSGSAEFTGYLLERIRGLYSEMGVAPLELDSANIEKIRNRLTTVKVKQWRHGGGMTVPVFGKYYVYLDDLFDNRLLSHEFAHVASDLNDGKGFRGNGIVRLIKYCLKNGTSAYGGKDWSYNNSEFALEESMTSMITGDSSYPHIEKPVYDALLALKQDRRKEMLDCLILSYLNLADMEQNQRATLFIVLQEVF